MARVSLKYIFKRQFSLAPDQVVDGFVRDHFVHNVLVNFGDIIFWLFGVSFLAYNTILPVYASTITDSPLVIGLIPALIESGWYVPQLFLVPWVERQSRLLPIIKPLTILERLPFLALAMLALWQNQLEPSILVIMFILLLTWRAINGGLVAMPYQELIATVIPVTHRGRFFGISHALAGLASVIGATIAAKLLSSLPYPRNYALIFFIGFLFIMVSFVFLILTKEPTRKISMHTKSDKRATVRRFHTLFNTDRNYRWFLLSRGLTYLGTMAAGFLAVYAVRNFRLSDAQAALYTAAMMASNTIGYTFWGSLADRWGYKRIAEISGLIWLGVLITSLLAPSGAFFYLVFILYGLSSSSYIIADVNIVMEFGSEQERPAYIGLTRTLTGPLTLVAPLLGGWLVSILSYQAMFMVSIGFALAGLLTLWRLVIEPRLVTKPAFLQNG